MFRNAKRPRQSSYTTANERFQDNVKQNRPLWRKANTIVKYVLVPL